VFRLYTVESVGWLARSRYVKLEARAPLTGKSAAVSVATTNHIVSLAVEINHAYSTLSQITINEKL